MSWRPFVGAIVMGALYEVGVLLVRRGEREFDRRRRPRDGEMQSLNATKNRWLRHRNSFAFIAYAALPSSSPLTAGGVRATTRTAGET